MAQADRRHAARANQRAAAFIRLALLGDHEAMHHVLVEVTHESDVERLGFVTAMASIAGSFGTAAYGKEGTLKRLEAIAQTSAAMHASDNIDDFFDGNNDGDGDGAAPQNDGIN